MVSKSQKDRAWSKAKRIPGKSPSKYRKDAYGNTLCYSSYGKNSPMGWEVDHIKPKSRGGSDSTMNLQALKTRVNRSKGADQRKRSRHSKSNR